MRRYIDVDKLKDNIDESFDMQDVFLPYHFLAFIDAQPTADAVKVIRCKDCKYRSKEWFEDKRFKGGGYWLFVCENDNIAERVYGLAHDKDYCSYGERADK